jgi:hypothetical protein
MPVSTLPKDGQCTTTAYARTVHTVAAVVLGSAGLVLTFFTPLCKLAGVDGGVVVGGGDAIGGGGGSGGGLAEGSLVGGQPHAP